LSVEAIQLQIMVSLLAKGLNTRYGRNNRFGDVHSYEDFSEIIPIGFYPDLRDDIEAMKSGRPDQLWPGTIDRFAASAGTTGEGKHLPLSDERLESDRRFMKKVAQSYLGQDTSLTGLIGKHLSLPGTVEQHDGIRIGEISGFSALRSPWWLRPFQLVDPRKLARLSFKEKFEMVLKAALKAKIKAVVAVPSWILTLFQKALEETGRESVSEIWPKLKLLICGGVRLDNYRPHLEKLAQGLELDFIETYGSSEGYFAFTDDLEKKDMKLVYDNGIFYEFIADPLPEMESLSIQRTVPLWEVETGVPYAMLVTTNSGLWRYAVNDIIEFTQVYPPRINVKGRLSEMLDEFGEALYAYEAEQALDDAVREMGLERGTFTLGGYLPTERELPRHCWFVQFVDPIHRQTLERLADYVDQRLRQLNRHYAIRRESGALGNPEMHSISQNDINRWMDFRGRDTAQGKLPRCLNDEEDIEFFLK